MRQQGKRYEYITWSKPSKRIGGVISVTVHVLSEHGVSWSVWDDSDTDVSEGVAALSTGEKNCRIGELGRDMWRLFKDKPPAQSRVN